MTISGVRVAVIGGGIAGACAALALAEVGAVVEVYEADSRSADVRGWLTLGPSAMTVLERLGVGDRVRTAGFPVVRAAYVDTRTGQGGEYSRYEPTHQWPSTHVWRRDLLAALRDRLDQAGVRCRYGCAARAEDLTADLIVGADGARSTTREAIGNATQLAFTGEVIRYCHHPKCVPGLPTGVLHFWTRSSGLVGYVGDVRAGSFWAILENTAAPDDIPDVAVMLESVRDTEVGDLIDASEVSTPIALYDLAPDGPWHTDRIVLVGDAAHAASPLAGRGATSAIEDAIVLARSLRQAADLPAGLEAFTAERRPLALAAYRFELGQPRPRVPAHELQL
ncbi:hypothetical protein AWN90_19205 [Nocardia terpenica]|uniref:FAD-binding domain-containing protein n=1 Tax=Nocardia terpenica TaxID=455432 RepID=A0A161WF12_9NOCA|nr:hypothetical protein AWN90_19205 [Nocardia terpenica]